MIEDIFLARTEEQQQFRQMLKAVLPIGLRKHMPTFSRLLPQAEPDAHASILLFYGAGGMGKTSLTRKLLQLATQDKAFKGNLNTLHLDWENEQKLTPGLNVGHDFIEPETVLNVLHRALVKAGWGGGFVEYDKAVRELRSAESKVETALQRQPESTLPDQVTKLGAKGLAYLIRLQPGAGAIGQEILETTLGTTIQVGAEGLYQVRRFVEKALTPKEYDLYQQPNERLAEALGKGLAKLAERKPLLLLLDTYEIVDRPDCDYTLRRVIQVSGERVLWVIAGRTNLADSGQRGKVYFRGYKRDFAETQLYAKSLSEFSLNLIQQYFAQVVPDRPLTEAEAETVARFSLGIPFVIRQAAVMYRDGKPLAEIVAPVDTPLPLQSSAYDQVVTETSERFLMHCFSAPEREKDLQAIYALALMRRPDPELLRQMLDEPDLELRLQTLRQRYSFILVEQWRLDEKLNRFLRAYLLNGIRRTSDMVQNLNKTAIAWLSLQLEQKTTGMTDTADRLQAEAIAELGLDLAHHYCWQGEDEGWRYLVPRFIEGWQYSRTWARSLVEVAESFRPMMGQDNQKRLSQLAAALADLPETESLQRVLDDLQTLERRGWLDEAKAELTSILRLKQGQLFYRQGRNSEALSLYSQVEGLMPAHGVQLKKDLADALSQIGGDLSVVNSRPVPSQAAKEALTKATKLDPSKGSYLIALGVAQVGLKQYLPALENLLTGIRLEGEQAYSLNSLGNAYLDLKRYDEAIAAYQQASQLNPTYAAPHNGLGNAYSALKRYDEAIAAYQQASQLDPTLAYPHNGLGNAYSALKRYGEAIAAYQQAIHLDPSNAYPHHGLGNAYRDLKRYDEAIAAYQQASQLDPTFVYPHRNLGDVYRELKRYDEAIAAYEQAIHLDPTDAYPHNGLGNAYRDLKRYAEAIAAYQQASQLDPTDVYLHHSLGKTYRDLKRYDEAIAAYQQASQLDPTGAYNKTELGLTYALQNQMANAYQVWQDALTLFEDNDADNLHKALYTLALGDPQTAFQRLDPLLQTDVQADAIEAVLIDVEVLAQCPTPPAGLDAFAARLKAHPTVQVDL